MRLINADEIVEILEHMEDDGISEIKVEAAIEILDDAPTVEIYKNLSAKEQNLRPCMVEGHKVIFHRWCGRSRIIEPSPLIGGHNGGVLQYTVALVEYEDGQIAEVMPCDIRFINPRTIWKITRRGTENERT